MIPLTLTVVYTYDHTAGTFIGTLPNGTRFRFIAADAPTELGPPAAIPVPLRMELHRLARQTADAAKAGHRPIPRTLGSPELSPEEFHAMVEDYLAKGGIIKQARRASKAKPSLADLNLDQITLDQIDI